MGRLRKSKILAVSQDGDLFNYHGYQLFGPEQMVCDHIWPLQLHLVSGATGK